MELQILFFVIILRELINTAITYALHAVTYAIFFNFFFYTSLFK